MYEQYKPLRNFLRGHNLWSGLGAIYFYTTYLQFDRSLPDQLKNGPLRFGQNNVAAGLHGHLVELLLRELVLNAQLRGGKPFNSAAVAFKTMQMIHKLSDQSWGLHDSRSNDIILNLSRIAFQQFPWQNSLTNGLVARYHMLYGHPLVAPMVEAEFGISAIELFQLILLLIEEVLQGPTPPLAFLPAAEISIHGPVLELCGRLSKSAEELRSLTKARQSYDVNWAYSFNPIREFPLIHSGNARSIMCPAPPILVQRLTDGLYFDLIKSDNAFGNAVGKAFEDYVGAVAARIGEGALLLLPEQLWGKQERRSVDWIIEDKSAVMFVECKLGRLDIASQTEIAPEPPFLAAIERLAGNVGQLYSTLNDSLRGDYPHWKHDGRPIHPLVVTFYEWFAFGPFFYRHLEQFVVAEFEKRGLNPSLLDQHPYTVCSIAEFEGLLTAARVATIDAVLAKKNSPPHRQSLLRGVLAELYPGSLSNAMGTFDEGMDAVVNGPSRLTSSRA